MEQAVQPRTTSNGLAKPIVMGIATLIIFAAMAFWGGLPSPENVPTFAAGVTVLLLFGSVVVGLGWHLLVRPMPNIRKYPSVLTAQQRLVAGLVLVVLNMMQGIGGAWDEGWHTQYGIPFGEDFFWRPHILIYISITAAIVFACAGWLLMVFRGKGTWVERFRADPSIGLMVLTGLFLVYALPADPLWHSVYGVDISAFSIPHVLLTILFCLNFIAGASLIVTSYPVRTWASILKFSMQDLIPLTMFSLMLSGMIPLLGADWYGIDQADVQARTMAAFQRPEWLPMAFIVFLGAWVGTLSVYTTRRYGAATFVGVLSVLIRIITIRAVNHPVENLSFWVLAVPPMIAVDVFAAFAARRAMPWWGAGIAAFVGSFVTLLAFNTQLLFPQIAPGNLPIMLLASVVSAFIGAWLGSSIGDFMAKNKQVSGEESAAVTNSLRWVPLGAFVVVIAFLAWFIGTATPPVV
jgi:hypothetical protein